jgi:hypothetical protein
MDAMRKRLAEGSTMKKAWWLLGFAQNCVPVARIAPMKKTVLPSLALGKAGGERDCGDARHPTL